MHNQNQRLLRMVGLEQKFFDQRSVKESRRGTYCMKLEYRLMTIDIELFIA